MQAILHKTIRASYYDARAEYYDELNDNNSQIINCTVEKMLPKYGAQRVLDLTCGTGSQVFWLLEGGFEVVGADISAAMLQIARQKAADRGLEVNFLLGDMRDFWVGEFDAVITISNSIGHLTKPDFRKTIANIAKNLKAGGIYIFDIFNLDYLQHKDNITKLTSDELAVSSKSSMREIQYNYVTHEGVLVSHSIYLEQKNLLEPIQISKYHNTLQCYTAIELKELLEEGGFEILEQVGIDGTQFLENQTDRILVVGKKL